MKNRALPLSNSDRAVIEVRELLLTTKDKEKVVRILINRGVDEAEARALVHAVRKANLATNRGSALLPMLGSGVVAVILLCVWVFAGRLFYIWLPLAAGSFIWFAVKFFMASGYEVEADNPD